MRRLGLVLVIILLCTAAFGAGLKVVPTTTLKAETANNTSAADSYPGSYTGNAAAGNVSKVPIDSLMYPGSGTKHLIAIMGWFGKSSHISVGYNSADPAQVRRQLSDMKSRGFDGLTIAWYGSSSTEQSNMTTKQIKIAAEQLGGFTFALRVNEGMIRWYSNGMTPTDAVIYHLNYAADNYFTSPAYMHINGQPVVLEFGLESYDIDWTKVKSSVRGNPMWIFRNAVGFTRPFAAAAFGWGPANDFSYLDWFYTKALTYPTLLTLGNSYKGFDDRLASWTKNRTIDQRCGQTWLDTFKYANKYYSATRPLPYLMVSTWNDYEEGTEIETGIDNCLSLTAAMSGGAINWTLNGGGSENTIHHYTVYASTDGEYLMPLTEIQPGNMTLNIDSFQLAPGSYTLFVKATGQPSIRNLISNGVSYVTANRHPTADLPLGNASGIDPLTVSAAVGSSQGSSTTQAVTAGQSASYTFVLEGTTGFSGVITFSCSGAPTAAVCSVPAPLSLNSAAQTRATVRVTTTSLNRHPFGGIAPPIALLFAAPLAMLLGGRRARRRKGFGMASFLLLALALGMSACGGGGSGSSAPLPRAFTPAGLTT